MKLARMTASDNSVFLGIDVHKKTYHISLIDFEGKKLCAKSIPACPESLVRFLKSKYRSKTIYSAYEAGFSGFTLHRKLVVSGIKSIVFNPASLPHAANDRVKTDKLDSAKIANSLLLGLLKPNHVPALPKEACRTLTRTRKQLVELRVATSNQIKAKLYQFGYIEASDSSTFTIKWLEKVLAQNSMPSSLKKAIKVQAEVFRSLSKQIIELEKHMSEELEKKNPKEAKIIQSIPGIGPVSASIILNELGIIGRFTSTKKIYSYTGLTPSEYSSGEKQRFGNISRQGNSRLRACLTEVAWRAIRKDEGLRSIYERLKQRRGAKKAILAVARRLVGRIRACILNNEMYRLSEA